MSSYRDMESHRNMVFDEVRNAAYAEAIRQAVSPDCTVLDLGAGLGIHGLLAARAGAGRVILLDPSPVVSLCLEVARDNGLADRVEVIRKGIEEVDALPPADVIISVFTGNFLLSEDLLPALFLARDRFLKPGGVLIPGRARMFAALVTAAAFHADHVARWSRPVLGIDYSRLRARAANTVYFKPFESLGAERLSEATELLDIEFTTARAAECRCRVEFTALRSGTCHGLLGWFDMRLGYEWLSTGPETRPTHWAPAFLPLDPPLTLSEGDTVDFELERPEFGEWTWSVAHGEAFRRHSSFHANVVDLASMKRASADSAPGLGEEGELALHVLSALAGGLSVREIIDSAPQRAAGLHATARGLERCVRDLVARWGGNAL